MEKDCISIAILIYKQCVNSLNNTASTLLYLHQQFLCHKDLAITHVNTKKAMKYNKVIKEV